MEQILNPFSFDQGRRAIREQKVSTAFLSFFAQDLGLNISEMIF